MINPQKIIRLIIVILYVYIKIKIGVNEMEVMAPFTKRRVKSDGSTSLKPSTSRKAKDLYLKIRGIFIYEKKVGVVTCIASFSCHYCY